MLSSKSRFGCPPITQSQSTIRSPDEDRACGELAGRTVFFFFGWKGESGRNRVSHG